MSEKALTDRILHAAPCLVLYVSRDRLCRYANGGASQRLGRPESALLGKPLGALLPAAMAAEIESGLENAIHEPVCLEHRLELPTGSASLHIQVIPDLDVEGVPQGHHIYAWDHDPKSRNLADYYDSKYTAREVEDNFIHLITTCQDAVVFVNAALHITLFTRSAEQIFGIPAGEALGLPLSCLMPEPYASEHDRYVARYLAGGAPRAIGKVVPAFGKRQNGEVFPIELSISELHINAHARFAAFIRDVSATRAMEQELEQRRQLATIGLTASIFAHEVGNPLNNMQLQAELLTRTLRKHGDPLSNQAQLLLSEVQRLTRLLGEFRQLSRPCHMRLEEVDVAALLHEIISTQRTAAHGTALQVIDEVPKRLPLINAHPDKLRQMFLNLVSNAIDAMEAQGTLTLRARAVEPWVEIQVVDTGPGVCAGLNILEPFVTTKSDGSGLGLAVAKRVVEDHGGTLDYHSRPRGGTTFTVRLPIQPPSWKTAPNGIGA